MLPFGFVTNIKLPAVALKSTQSGQSNSSCSCPQPTTPKQKQPQRDSLHNGTTELPFLYYHLSSSSSSSSVCSMALYDTSSFSRPNEAFRNRWLLFYMRACVCAAQAIQQRCGLLPFFVPGQVGHPSLWQTCNIALNS